MINIIFQFAQKQLKGDKNETHTKNWSHSISPRQVCELTSSKKMKWGIFLVLLACCLYFTTARPNDIVSAKTRIENFFKSSWNFFHIQDPDDSKEKSQPEIAKNSTNGELDDGNSQSEYKFVIGNDLDDE